MADTIIFLTTTGAGNWTVPADCTSATIECIGGGGGGTGNASRTYSGGGGGAYAKKNTLSFTPGDSISYSVGVGGALRTAGGDSWFNSTSTVLAKGGESLESNSVQAKGGQSSSCVGDVKYSGGNGWQGAGGAAGLNGIGGDASGFTGGTADAGYGGSGGVYGGADAGNGTEWDATHGSGGGGNGVSGSGGLYGGGGGRNVSGGGAQGLIVITYTPAVGGSSKFFQLF